MKRKIFIILLLTLAFSIPAQADEERMIDSFEEISCNEMIARLDNLQIELRNEPQSIAFIIVYEGKHRDFFAKKERYILPKFGDSAARTKTMQERLVFSKYYIKSFIFVDGGFREKYTVEFYIVPKGAIPPNPTPTLTTMKYRKGNPTNTCYEF